MKKVKEDKEQKLTLTDWEAQMVYQLLNTQGISNVPLKVLAAMLDVRGRLKPGSKEKAELSEVEAKVVYDIAVNPEVRWALDERSLALYKKLEEFA